MGMLNIALLQIAPCAALKENLEKGMEACKKAKETGAHIALFPEMWSNGYNLYGRPAHQWKGEAIPANGEFVNSFGNLAKELELAIGVTLLQHAGFVRPVWAPDAYLCKGAYLRLWPGTGADPRRRFLR